MSLHKRSLMFILLVLGLLAGSVAVVALKPTVLGLDLQGGSQVILQASDTPDAKVTQDSLNRAVRTIRNRVDKLGTAEPEIQTEGNDKISVALPGVEDPQVVDDLVKAAQLTMYTYQPNLVGYVNRQGPSANNPSTDLYALIQLAKQTPATDLRQGAVDSVYLFRKDAAHTYVAGPAPTLDQIIKLLQATDKTKPLADEYTANPKKFDVQTLPRGFVILTDATSRDNAPLCGQPGGTCVLLQDHPGLSGSDVKGANLGFDNANRPAVDLQFSGAGKRKFAALTKEIVQGARAEGRPSSEGDGRFWNFAISLDGVMISSPFVSYVDNPGGIDSDRAQISGGNFTESGAKTLADQIASGAIPIRLDSVSLSTVSATLGEQSLRQGLIAGLVGLAIVMLALVAYYRVLGVIASLSLIIYGLYFWAIAKLVPISLTLPGIAGVILTIGVAADASVVIFERVREEARAGRPARAALLNGYKRGITAIVDANIVTLVTAVFIFLLSTAGPRGFAFTLILGVLVSLFTAIVATQGAFGLLVESKLFRNERLMGFNVREIKWKMDVVGRWKMWLAISFVPMIIGVLIIGIRGLEPGLDFTGGTQVRVAFVQNQPQDNAVRDELAKLGFGNAKIQSFKTVGGNEREGVQIETRTLTNTETTQLLGDLEKTFGALDREQTQINSVSGTFGRDIVRNAIYAIIFSFLAIILYLSFRFEYKLALPALASVVHDVWLALTIYSIAGKEVTGATVAALLTILGYSLYDVVILFDRIRENIPLMRGKPYREIVNRSVHETLTRSIITMALTLLPILSLLIFGGETLFDFSFALFVGILSGGVSSIFISAPLAALWKEREPDARKAAARAAKKAARAAAVDADIMDVRAFARAEAAIDTPNVAVETGDDAVDISSNGHAELPAEVAQDEPGLELEPEVEPGPPEPEPAPDGAAPSDGASTPAAQAPPKPPERERRHRNVQRKRRR